MREWLGRIREAPWKFGFISLMRRLGAVHANQPRIGLAGRPRQEAFRLGQAAALSFAPREIAELAEHPAGPLIRLYGLGLLGPHGPLPLHFTEMVRERKENHHDGTLADFLDIFHHRYLTLMYRAWAQSQAAAGLDRPDEETFSAYIARLTGHDPCEIRASALPAHARLAASPHLSRDARHPDGLAQTLARFFAVPVQLQEFVMHWIPIDEADRSCLGVPRPSSVMGVGALAGEAVPDRQNKFRLVIGPLDLDQYLRFTPQGKDLPVLVEWVRGFVGFEFVWEVELRVRRDSAPPTRLEDRQRLGWSTWLGAASSHASAASGYATGMVFEPEACICAISVSE